MKILKARNTDSLIYIFLSLIIILFANNKYIPYIFPILISILIILSQKKRINVPWICLVFILIACDSLLLSCLRISIYTSIKAGLQEFIRNNIYILVIIIVSNIRLSMDQYRKIWLSMLFLMILIQIFQLFKILNINYILANIYDEESINLRTAQVYNISSLSLFRAGSVFINPNQYSRIILLILCIILGYDIPYGSYNKSNRLKNITKIVLVTISLILTGSRTAFVIFIILLVFYRNNLYKYRRLIAIALIFLFCISNYLNINLSELRFTKIHEGISNSIVVKFNNLGSLISQFNPYNIILGVGPFNEFKPGLTAIDFDLGYLYAYYGIFGIVLYVALFCYLIKSSEGHHRELVEGFLIVLLFSAITGGIMLNLRVFCTAITIIFVKIDEDSLLTE